MCIPHLGASTAEAEDNCAEMAARQIINFLETGTIVNSVNFPNAALATQSTTTTTSAKMTIITTIMMPKKMIANRPK